LVTDIPEGDASAVRVDNVFIADEVDGVEFAQINTELWFPIVATYKIKASEIHAIWARTVTFTFTIE
jgi:hypothetical protein